MAFDTLLRCAGGVDDVKLKSTPSGAGATTGTTITITSDKDVDTQITQATQSQSQSSPTEEGEEGEEGEKGEKGENDWSVCVHALNALRLLLVDSALAHDVDKYISPACILAVNGFCHPEWGVRNSSMMLFASIVQRAVDNDKRSDASTRGSTAKNFFSRYPDLLPFLVTQLDDIVPHVPTERERERADWLTQNNGVAGTKHPSLYPILLLLGKMRPDAAAGSAIQAMEEEGPKADQDQDQGQKQDQGVPSAKLSAKLSVASFIPILERCACAPEQKVRIAAGKGIAGTYVEVKSK